MLESKDLAEFSWKLVEYINYNHEKVLKVSDDVEQKRREICGDCEHFDKEEQVCKLCGCFIPQKASHVFENCPAQKWSKDKESWLANFDQLCQDIDNAPEYR